MRAAYSVYFMANIKNYYRCLILIFCTCSLISKAQDTDYIPVILQRIANHQVGYDSDFLTGIFPSYISNKPYFSAKKKDNNMFYNGLVVYTLQNVSDKLSPANKIIADSIKKRTQALLPQFKNKNGRDTYNFWRTNSNFTFPYTWWIPLLRGRVTLPDDMDDTVLSLLAQDTDTAIAKEVHTLMQQYANKGTVKTTFKSYRNQGAYSTWFGKKVPVVFDIAVLCNILGFVQHYNLEWTHADSASLQLILTTIDQKDHIRHPEFVAPYYGKTSLIFYHLARLMCIKPIPELEAIKPQLAAEATELMDASGNILEKILLATTLIKWGYHPAPILLEPVEQITKAIEQNDFCFFIGNIPSYQRQPFKEILIKEKILLFYHYCPAYNDALLLEYLLLSRP